MRSPGIGTAGPDDRPRDMKLCFVFRADQLAGLEGWVDATIGAVSQQVSRERQADGGIRDSAPLTFQISGKPGGGQPIETWFQVSPTGLTRFSARTTEGFDAKLLLAVRKWGTRTFFLDLEQRSVENWSMRREESVRTLLDRAPGQVIFHPVILVGEFIPEEELTARREAWHQQVTAAHEAHIAALRTEHSGKWALLSATSHTDRRGQHILPGPKLMGVYDTEADAEQAAEDYRGLCYVLNIATGQSVSRWAER